MPTTKKLFVAGLMSSGTTVTLDALLHLGFGSGTEPFVEGREDPNCPQRWKGRWQPRFPEDTRESIRDWVNSYCKGNWFIEKTPTRFTHFLAIQELFGDSSHFIVVQRNPFQILGSRTRGRLHRMGVKTPRVHDFNKLLLEDRDFIEMWRSKLQYMIRFHRELLPHLNRFKYVRYENLCARPVETLLDTLDFLCVSIQRSVVERVCRDLNIHLLHKYDVKRLDPLMLKKARKLASLWNYPIPIQFRRRRHE